MIAVLEFEQSSLVVLLPPSLSLLSLFFLVDAVNQFLMEKLEPTLLALLPSVKFTALWILLLADNEEFVNPLFWFDELTVKCTFVECGPISFMRRLIYR